MGMFDTVYIESIDLPVSQKAADILKGEDYQTKSLDCQLDTINLKMGSPPVKKLFNSGKIELDTDVDTITFYTTTGDDNGDWWEFEAMFKDGALVIINLIIAPEWESKLLSNPPKD